MNKRVLELISIGIVAAAVSAMATGAKAAEASARRSDAPVALVR